MIKRKSIILIAEPDITLAESIEQSLRNLGYVVAAKASTKQEAISLSERLEPDLILIATEFQDQDDGIEAADQIWANLDIPIVYTAGDLEEDSLEEAKKTEPYGFVFCKPISDMELRSTIEVALYKHSAEKKIRESEKKYRFLAEKMSDVIWMADTTPHLTYASPSVEKHLGYSAEEFISLSFEDFLVPSSYQLAMEIFSSREKLRASDGNSDDVRMFVVECIHKDGSIVPAELVSRSVYDEYGNFSGLLGVSRNISDRKRTEDELRRSEERFRNLIDQASDAIFVHDLNGKFLDVNRQACSSLGYSRDELLTMSVVDVDPNIASRGDRSKFWPNVPVTFEAEHTRKDGSVFPVEVRLGPIEYGNNKVVLALISDITERKRSEDLIKKSLEEKELLLREIHHRVKNNLAFIQSLIRIQARHTKDKEMSASIQQMQRRIQSMILAHELLYRSDNFQEIEISRYTGDLLSQLRESFSMVGRRIEIHRRIEEMKLAVDITVPIGFILTELISNCYQHAFRGRRSGLIIVNLRKIEGNFELIVKDDGVGMPEDFDLENLNTMGYRLVTIFVNQLNGKIEVIRKDGTEVRIIFSVK